MYMRDNGDRTFPANFDSHRLTFAGANFVVEKFSVGMQTKNDKQIQSDEIVYYDGGGADGYECKHTKKSDVSPKDKLIYDEVVYYDGGGVEGYGDSEKN